MSDAVLERVFAEWHAEWRKNHDGEHADPKSAFVAGWKVQSATTSVDSEDYRRARVEAVQALDRLQAIEAAAIQLVQTWQQAVRQNVVQPEAYRPGRVLQALIDAVEGAQQAS